MNKTAKILFLMVGCIAPIFVGAMHTLAHFNDLVTPEIQEYLQKEIVIQGQSQAMWSAWAIVSVMMGASFITIGLLNVNILKSTPKDKALPILAIIAMIFYQICVVFSGYEYNGSFQLYGGMFGLVVATICLMLTLKVRSQLE